MRWPWHRHTNGSAEIRRQAEEGLDTAKRNTPIVARRAPELDRLTEDEFANRIARAFRRRPA